MTPQDKRAAEAARVKDFVDSDVWAWLRDDVLTPQRDRLLELAATVRGGLTSEDRAVLLGMAALATRILNRPARLTRMAHEVRKAVKEPYRRKPAPAGTGDLA